MSTGLKGNATEAAVLQAFVVRGFDVLVPFGEGQPYDLVIHLAERGFLRVQCKTARPVNGCLVFNSRGTDHGRGRQPYLGLADVFGVFFPPRDAVYLIPVDGASGFCGRLRLEPARNNQKRGIRFAADYEIDRWTPASLRGLVEMEGSSPDDSVTVA
jgi:PD-(D/E)XK endonuclease